jgi:murein L,D-transpeptidase YcbB/YkuD
MREETLAPRTPERLSGRLLTALLVVALLIAGVAAVAFIGGSRSPLDLLSGGGRGEAPDAAARAFASYLERRPDSPVVTGLAGPEERQRIHGTLVAFYEANGHRPAWFDGRKPSREARELIELLRGAGRDGLDPARYRPAALESKLDGLGWRPGRREIYPLDTLLSQTFVLYAHHLATGRVHPESLGPAWLIAPREVKLPAALERASEAGPEAVAERLRPPHEGYEALVGALERYRRLAREGGWPKVPEGPVLEEGDRADPARLEALAARLAAEGDLEADHRRLKRPSSDSAGAGGATAAVYGRTLAAAVHRFQERHGITEDGKLGPETSAALNVSAAQRVRQIELNLERWRWLPGGLGSRRLEVNLPGYFLRLVDGDRTVGTMKVVVGTAGAATPVFGDEMSYVAINPYWNVPESIVAEEIAPQAAADPSWLARNGYEVVDRGGEGQIDPYAVDWAAAQGGGFPHLVRQPPGPGNALGDIKFMFPNDHNIYLHDTPATHLFDEVERTLSHGCIRVEKPVDLAEFVFRGDPRWRRERVERAIASGERIDVPLQRKLPVYLLYWTAWVDDEGTTHFRKDIYGHDRALAEALAGQRRTRQATRTASRST